MKAGIALTLAGLGLDRPDHDLYQDELKLIDLAEPLGLDSIWSLEHHFTGYNMVPNPTQMLSYFAARTKRVQLGTAVIVLPWHNPVRVAEDIALLDVLSGGRTIFGFGRGTATVEFERLDSPQEESRERFAESATIIRKALTQEVFSHDGKFWTVPPTSIRPRPISHPEQRFYASTVSPESSEMMARMGFGVMIIAQSTWENAANDYHRYCDVARSNGYGVKPPIALLTIIVSEDAGEAMALGDEYIGKGFEHVNLHYGLADGHLAKVKGYEFWGRMAKAYTKLSSPEDKQKAVDFFKNLQMVGTPAQVLEKFRHVCSLTGLGHAAAQFLPAAMPYHLGERSLKLFAEKVLPTLHRDPAFQPKAEGEGAAANL
jgi:alkanesulfonate monooxygenase SsuD/methylene tetrahydromethanopterin reductase-like flavin-dependent oxidoreductase (luciferase family)